MKTFLPDRIYYEPRCVDYPLGKQLIKKYKDLQIPMEMIDNHNNIEQLRTQPNTSFTRLKKHLIIGIRKTHKYVENQKVSDFLVPYTSSGCSAMCLYCYLVCNYNKCSYLRLFVNREEMMEKLIKKASSLPDNTVFEIGSNSDLVLENTITGNLPWTIEQFTSQPRGMLTFPTKFSEVEPLLELDHKNRVIARVSLNPEIIINKTEFGTSNLQQRIHAINLLCDAGYPVGVLIAPIVLIDGWENLYKELFETMWSHFSAKAKRELFFEAIFMTYSFIHDKINSEAFPNALQIFDREQMTGRGRGKYWYKPQLRSEAENYIRQLFQHYFPDNKLLYIV